MIQSQQSMLQTCQRRNAVHEYTRHHRKNKQPSRLKGNQQLGFTLIEVLIALAILAIALTALIRISAITLHQIANINHRHIASWVGMNVATQARLHFIGLPRGIQPATGHMPLLGQDWVWTLEKPSNPFSNRSKIIPIKVTVTGHQIKSIIWSHVHAAV